MKIFLTLFTLLLFSTSTQAKVPAEIQGVWISDIEKTIALMKAGEREKIAFMKDRYLPNLKRIINEKNLITISSKREFKADIRFKEKRGENVIMLLTGKTQGGSEMLITFIPKEAGRYIMKTSNESDGSGSIVWKKE